MRELHLYRRDDLLLITLAERLHVVDRLQRKDDLEHPAPKSAFRVTVYLLALARSIKRDTTAENSFRAAARPAAVFWPDPRT